jgi:all-trans-retinol 13,14-reductase
MAAMTPSTLRIGYRYRPKRLAPEYDAVVIGSGMGGLTTAALLSALGWKVCVLEQHYTAGGFTHSFERNGYEWDVGVHYIGEVGAQTRSRRMFDFLSDGKLEWAPMDTEFDRFYVGNKVFNARAGKQEFRDNLLKQFPKEQQAIDNYMKLLTSSGGALSAFGMGRAMKPWLQSLAQPFLNWKTPNVFFRNTYDVLSELTDDQELIAVLCGQWGDMGLPPKQSTFLAHAMIARHYLYGGYYPIGGAWKIAESIIPKIQKAGGEVFTYARVKQILVENGRVRGVEMKDGHRIDCTCVISSAGIDNTFNHLLPADVVKQCSYKKKLEHVQPSFAHLGVYIGLAETAEELGLPKTNYWIYPSSDYDADVEAFLEDKNAPFPVVYISFPSAKDPDYLNRHPGTSTIEIVAPAPYQKLPQLRGKIDYFEVSTPLSTDWFGGYRHGELYGLAHTTERMQQKWLRPQTKIAGLWLTGQDILTCGVTGAMMAGMLTTMSMVGTRKMAPLMKQIYS